jgi:hypothetical protein
MKNFGVITVSALVLAFAACNDFSREEELRIQREVSAEQAQLRLDREAYEATAEMNRRNDSIVKAALEEKRKAAAASLRDSFQLIRAYTSNPNTAGGVDLHIIWKNKTRRTIKYANFRVTAINAVGDEVRSEIGHYGTAVATGPIRPGVVNGYGTYWDCMWYNSSIRKCKVTSVDLEFMDGTFLEIKL